MLNSIRKRKLHVLSIRGDQQPVFLTLGTLQPSVTSSFLARGMAVLDS